MGFLVGILGWFKGLKLKHILYALAAAALAFFVWQSVQFVDDKYEAERRVEQLEDEVEGYEESIRILKEASAQKDRANDTADAVRNEQVRLRFNYDEIRRDAASAKEEDDAPVAPVLQRTLDALDGL